MRFGLKTAKGIFKLRFAHMPSRELARDFKLRFFFCFLFFTSTGLGSELYPRYIDAYTTRQNPRKVKFTEYRRRRNVDQAT